MNNINNFIDEISLLIKKNDLKTAKIKTNQIITTNPSNEIFYNILGIINLKLKMHSEAVENFKKAIEINNTFISALVNLGIAYQDINQISEAIKTYEKVIEINPSMYEIHNDIGLMYRQEDNSELALKHFNRCIEIKNDYDKAYFNLGTTNKKLDNLEKALTYLNKTIKINPKNNLAYFEIAEIYRKQKKYNKAIKFYSLSNNEKMYYKKLQCYFEEGSQEKYDNELKKIIEINPNDRRIASLAAFAAYQFNTKNIYPFCPDPIKFVYKSSIKEHITDTNSFIHNLLEELSDQNFNWEPKGRTTIKGFATRDLSDSKLPNLKKLENIIFKQLKKYYDNYKGEKINFILNKPNDYKFVCWSNRLKKEGYNMPHMHPSGWVSGVFYLKIPSQIKGDEAGIQFHLEGDDFIVKDNKLPIKKITPAVGDIVMFPSSLFHSTIPFASNEERVCIAFDLCNANLN
tara:strand:- start:4247 stop:5623 length:1377 start_codon:yes stop_codon:yes gene_type:complete